MVTGSAAARKARVTLDPLLTLDEQRKLSSLHEHLLRPHRGFCGDTARLDLHQFLADRYRRLVHVEGLHLVARVRLTLDPR